jgi:hypothetical protein
VLDVALAAAIQPGCIFAYCSVVDHEAETLKLGFNHRFIR